MPESESNEPFVAELTGMKLRRIGADRARSLKVGDKLSNIYGQQLWEVVRVFPEGVRVNQWPVGMLRDLTWDAAGKFCESID